MRKLTVPILFLIIAFAGCKSSVLDDPSTTISFAIPERAHVKLTIDNSYNTTVATIIDTIMFAGVYRSNLDTQHLPEGMYFYTMEAKGVESSYYYKQTKYFALVK